MTIRSLYRTRYRNSACDKCALAIILISSTILVLNTRNLDHFVETVRSRRNVDSAFSICESMLQHAGGRWHHNQRQSIIPTDTAPLNEYHYLPQEMDWLRGTSKEWANGCKNADLRGHMYASTMGNQCGCGAAGFEPTDSKWVWDKADGESNVDLSPSFQLLDHLAKANQTMCFAGDSIDLQFYTAIVNNLMRLQLFQKQYPNQHPIDQLPNISIQEQSIPVVYSNETTGPTDYKKFWMTMKDIQETTVILDYVNEERHSAFLRFFKAYGWSPWNFLFMDDCDILIYNLGIHYDAQGDMIGLHYGPNKYSDDFVAAVTYLAGFGASGKEKVAVWRSTLPQHFNGTLGDGHYPGRNTGCIPLPTTGNGTVSGPIQNFNKAAETGFAKYCGVLSTKLCGQPLEHTCTMNTTDTNVRTVYKHLIDNNVTKLAEAVKQRGDLVTGNILHWNIADLFDVSDWHSADDDCSHFCYIPALYEEAFRRLGLLLAWSKRTD